MGNIIATMMIDTGITIGTTMIDIAITIVGTGIAILSSINPIPQEFKWLLTAKIRILRSDGRIKLRLTPPPIETRRA
jgi:hypothetical protein